MKRISSTLLGIILFTSGMGLIVQPVMASSHGCGKHHCMHKGHKAWMGTLNEKQQKKIDKLHLDYKKKKLLLKAQLKQAKVELALLITSGSPKKSDTDKKIDEILKLKKEKMSLKVDHKIEVRSVLNEEQRVKFDMHVLKKAYRGKHRCKH